MRQAPSSITTAGDIGVNIRSFVRSLRAKNVSPRTVETYTEAAIQLGRFVQKTGMPSNIANLRREYVEAFINNLLETRKAATASNRFRGLQRFFGWLLEEGRSRSRQWST